MHQIEDVLRDQLQLHLALTITGSLPCTLTRPLPVCTTQAKEGFLSVGVATLSVIYGCYPSGRGENAQGRQGAREKLPAA